MSGEICSHSSSLSLSLAWPTRDSGIPGSPLYKSRSSGALNKGGALVLARLGLGPLVGGLGSRHWAEMVANPRTPITHTHLLLP